MANLALNRQSNFPVGRFLKSKQTVWGRRFSWYCVIAAWFPILVVSGAKCVLGQALESAGVARQAITIDSIKFTVPETLKLEKVAGEPLIRWPVASDWDRDGSLLVLESNWNRESVQQQLESKPHRVVRLEDVDGDGFFDKRTVVANQLSFSAGVLAFDRSIFVSSPPSIFKHTDTTGDGIYDQREIWYDGGTLTHCANDLHGPFLGPDGWIYWTKGAFAEQQYQTRDGKVVTSKAAHLLRRHPDGGPVDILMTGGMDNPSDVAFLPNGERLFCSTFMHHPGDGLRDGIGHAIYGALFGKKHAPVDAHLRTGDLFDPIEELGPAAPASITLLRNNGVSNQVDLPSSENTVHPGVVHPGVVHPVIVSTQFNLQKLAVHRLVPAGGTYTTETKELLSADRVDFHPVDVLEDRDGSLIILDTGGWYDLCCPSSGTAGQVAPGGIYRLKPNKNQGESTSNRRLAEFWETAQKLVGDPDNPSLQAVVLQALASSDESLQQAAANVVAIYRWEQAVPKLIELLQSDSPLTQRLAVECLGRIVASGGSQENAPKAIDAMFAMVDRPAVPRALQHAVLYALMTLDAEAEVRTFLTTGSPRQRIAALTVLEQTHHTQAGDVPVLLQLAGSEESQTRGLAIEILAAHSEFASEGIDHLSRCWSNLLSGQTVDAFSIISAWRDSPEVIALVASWLNEANAWSMPQRQLVFRLLANLRGEPLPEAWQGPMVAILQGPLADSLELMQSLSKIQWTFPRDQAIVDWMLGKANQTQLDFQTRLSIIACLPPSTNGIDPTFLRSVIQAIPGESSAVPGELAEPGDKAGMADRCLAVLANVRLTEELASLLIDQLGSVPAVRLRPVVLALLATNSPRVDAALLKSLGSLPSAKTLAREPILAAVKNRSAADQAAWTAVFDALQAVPADVARAVDDWLAKLPGGDPVAGYQVFRGRKASCSGCHQVGYVGSRIGPELTRIGRSRSRRDLVEAILFPSARLEQSYRSTRVLTVDGRVFHGMVVSMTDTQLELLTGVNETQLIPLEEIELQAPSEQSLMPAGLENVLSIKEFADLLAFLEAAR